MKRRPFGRAGFDVSEIGFGAWGIGGSMWGRETDDDSAMASLRRAADAGVNFFDTALVYGDGHSEGLVGALLRERRGENLLVASKVPPKNMHWPARHDTPARDVFPKDWIVQCVDKSLKNLRVERLDLAQFHVWSDSWMKEDEWWRAVEDLKKAGKLRHWGVSINDHEPDTALEVVRSGRAESVQVIYNIFDQTPRKNLFPLCREKKCAVIVRVPFDEGALTGTFTARTAFPEGDFRGGYFKGRLDEVVRRIDKLKFLIDEGWAGSMPQAALKFCLSDPAVATVIPGMRKPSRVDDNVQSSDGKLFPPEVLERLKSHTWVRW